MRGERATLRQRPRHLAGQLGGKPAPLIDLGQLLELSGWIARELSLLEADVGLLGIALGADGDILAGGHRERAGDQPGDARR